ncbi:MAG: T9SS type A sorting domain-containing protein [Altibacter sp.]|uniref:T9SS type A sorting domain-containing protein n=1 Tax=Altibacter sp. TaxID=2024823 RepID=UPI001D82C567|nr:T9SS type A sorting domain-containing protein [Altibacter sp.]MBZ0326129.1 T9SS type A sorting domain-containing protein [Altibacter sp.]
MNTRLLFTILVNLLFLQQVISQYTLVPDANFEQVLIDLGIDSEGTLDGQFLTTDGIGVSDLIINNRNINDLTGIEAFVDLSQLFAHDNEIDSIDLSLFPTAMVTLSLGNNNLTSIDLTPMNIVLNLGLYANNFTELDVSNLSNLAVLEIGSQNIANVNLTNANDLQVLGFSNTAIQNINLSDCSSLRNVYCEGSQIQALDFSSNQSLEWVEAYSTPLTTINLPNNPNLEILDVSNTVLTELDITNCPGLLELYCSDIGLTTLDLAQNVNLEYLQCANNQIINIDFTQNSNLVYIGINNNLIGPNLELSSNINLTDLHCSNNPIVSLSGLQNCVNIEIIGCDETLLTEVDLSQNPNLDIVSFFQSPNLQFANIKNGNNENIFFIGTQCPELTCVVVDDPSAPNTNILIDSHTTLVENTEDCDDLSISENELQKLFSFYPNPVKDVLFIESNFSIEIESLQIYSLLGELVMSRQGKTHQIDVSKLRSGVYFLKVSTSRGEFTKKLLKK